MSTASLRSLRRRDLSDPDGRLAYLVLASTVPAGLIGYLLEDFFAEAVRNPWVVVFNLVLVGVLFIVGEAVGRRTRQASKLTFWEAAGVGLAQAAALVPGIFRSGATITCGLFLGLRRDEAARFSFLMSIPIILGAGGLELFDIIKAGMGGREGLLFLIGAVSSAAVGYSAIRFFISYLTRHTLRVFAYYRFVLAVVAAVLLLTVG